MLSDSVMICQWAKLFTQLMRSRMTICSGVSNGSAALATIRAFPASPRSMFVWRSSPKARRTAQRTSAFLSSREENGEDRCWSAALRLDRFRLVEAPARDYESVGVPRSCELDATSLRMVALGMGILNLFTAFCQASSGTDARSGVQAETIWDA